MTSEYMGCPVGSKIISQTNASPEGNVAGWHGQNVTYNQNQFAIKNDSGTVTTTIQNGVATDLNGRTWDTGSGACISQCTTTSISDTTTATNVLSSVAGVKKYTIYMPQNTGTITFSWTTAGTAVTGTAPSANSGLLVANQAVKGSIALTVSNPAVDAAAAAAEEATAAANDATDAALSAAEAAEAATAMAQEAVDAVAELSASVTKLISALRAQITTLTNLVVKIQKKVKA